MTSEQTRATASIRENEAAAQLHDACGCGHAHHHDGGCAHAHHHDGGCGHAHTHHHDGADDHTRAQAHRRTASERSVQRIYTVQNVGCAHCAAEIQRQVNQLDGVDDCVLVFETHQLRVTGKDPDALLPKIRKVCTSVERGARIIAPEDTQEDETGHPLTEILIGAGLFIAGEFVLGGMPKVAVMLVAYVLLGWHVLLTAVKNIGKGRVFDENLLMALATIGAWAIGSFDEAVGVMLFYRVGEYF